MEEEEKLNTVSFSFYPIDHNFFHDIYLNFSVHEDMDIYELHRLCKRFALVLGYSEDCVERVFREDCD